MRRIDACLWSWVGLTTALVLGGCGSVTRVAHGPAASPGATTAAVPSAARGQDLFAAHCARCHGADAMGTANAPNLVSRVKGMSEANFSSAVLQRYSWRVPAGEGASGDTQRESMISGVLARRADGGGMPAWESQSDVVAGVKNLYAYLSRR